MGSKVTVTTTHTEATSTTVTQTRTSTQTIAQTTTTVTTVVTIGQANYNQTLVDQAEAEGGQVTVYGVMNSSDWQTIDNVLMQSFPWMKVNFVSLSTRDIAARGIAEYQAGKVQADLFYDTLGPVEQLISAGAVQSYENYEERLMNYSVSDPRNLWHPGFGSPIVLIYNTNKVSPSELPTTIEGINASAWAGGKLVIDNPSLLNASGTLFASVYYADFHGDNASWTAWLNSIKALNPVYTSSSRDVYTNVSTGQAEIGVGLLGDVISGGRSAPVLAKYFTTTYTIPVMSAMAKHAPHPYTAELLIQWFSSYAGQVVMALTGRTPLMSVVVTQYFGAYIPLSTTLVTGGMGGTYYTEANDWANFYQQIFPQ